MSGAEYARLRGIKYTTFTNWRQQRRREQQRTDEAAPFFEEVKVRMSGSDFSGLKVSLPGGACVVVERADQFPMVVALLRYLEHSC